MTKREQHPYGEFFPKNARMMIVGSFPIGKFSDPSRHHEIKPHEFDFYFGGERNLLWKLVGDVYGVKFTSKDELVEFLVEKKIAIGDVIKSCIREEGRASDSDLLEIEWNKNLLNSIRTHKISFLLFTSKQVMKWFNKLFPNHGLKEFLLLSPSAQSARSIVRMEDYNVWKEKNPKCKTYEFLLNKYKGTFNTVEKLISRDL